VDVNPLKVDCLNEGESPIVEPEVAPLIRSAHDKGMLSGTIDGIEAIVKTDVSMVCVGTPSRHNGSLNLDFVFGVAEEFGRALQAKTSFHTFVIRSTVLPGTVQRASEIIERVSAKALGKDFGVASNPEFLREGSSVADFENPPFTIVGASDQHVEEILRILYKQIPAPFHGVAITEAEFLKYACNAFHAVKVVFGNEIGAICKQFGIDSHAVMDLFCKDTKLNISPAYFKPGFAFGGSCLPKDVRAITYEAQRLDVQCPLLDSLISSNEIHVQRVIDWVIERKNKKVGVLGLSFKSDTDDLRESPIVRVVETLLGKGFDVSIYDANVNLSRLIGANKRFIEQEIPHISSHMKGSAQEVVDASGVIIIANKGADFDRCLANLKPDQAILDLVRIQNHGNRYPEKYEGICW